MKKFKKISSFLCVLALTASCFSVSAFAAGSGSIPEVEVIEA